MRVFTAVVTIVLFVSIVSGNMAFAQTASKDTFHKYDYASKLAIASDYSNITASPFWSVLPPQFASSKPIFTLTTISAVNGKVEPLSLALKPGLRDFYQEVGFFGHKSQNTVFVYPIFTQAAYSENGFYKYFKKKCDTSCLTVSIPTKIDGRYTSSIGAAMALSLLHYPHITDIDIDKNPDILKKYDRIILLHNEYVTRKEFQAITSRPNVVYLYPNALYAEVNANYDTNTITLVRGHGFPIAGVGNGFGWKYDNSRFEYDDQCTSWKFYKIDNGMMLNCYPDNAILYDGSIIRALQEEHPADLKYDVNELLGNSTETISNHELLDDLNVDAYFIPPWFTGVMKLFAQNDISEKEFTTTVKYLHEKNLIR